MRRRAALTIAALLTALAGVSAGLIVATPGTAAAERFAYQGIVTRVVDGDTIDVRLSSGRRERVRLIGIDTPERGACFSSQASSRARALALNKRVTLRGDVTQDLRDRYGRLLAYVDIAGRTDLAQGLIRGGYGSVYVYKHPFARVASYRAAQASASTTRRGLWSTCRAAVVPAVPLPPTQAAPSGGCHPNYTNCLPIVGDLDCADVRRMGKAPVQVLGADPYRLDGDNDGLGCE